MQIILTHEQADFDALASLLGAHLVDESSQPVLPRRMNRNVRAFLTLYGMELPFVDPRDLNGTPVTRVTLVDTQSMISVKGMSEATVVQVIDHHPLREDIPDAWKVTTEETGATTTLFVEILRERDTHLNTIPATLLLLGIYEDTGSLTFTRTTSRDLNAAAFLLERGASLEIASDFLNHPLSLSQQELYDRLQASLETLRIHGHTILLACGEAHGLDEELSSVAHKLQDVLDPDALFLLVTTRGGVQLIARSTSQDIDVAQIASRFGGGGHSRAAAGMIPEGTLEAIRRELVAILPDYVRPAITVSQIMSRGPQLLSPHTPVEEAARRMQRYGYEGYPVVEETADRRHRILGLLTRRAVDRALSHNLRTTAGSLMDAGQVSVTPEDSIEHLQHVMTESGWGQVPVVAENGLVVGIVTRTDLLKTLTRQVQPPGWQNLSSRLETALPPARLALLKTVARLAHEQQAALYIVGGFVRDLLLERPSLDFDLVVEGDAIRLARALARKFGGRVTSHARFGTAKWHIAEIRVQLAEALGFPMSPDAQDAPLRSAALDLPNSLDLISARTEFYTYPTALPTVERGSIKLDLHRRDFTINTLALRLDGHHYGELHDYWGGLSDLRGGLVRVLHSLSFVDDPTRMLRAVRFEQRFRFRIEERTLELIREAKALLAKVSGDRIRHELDHILEEPQAASMLARLSELELLAAIHPDLVWDAWSAEKVGLLHSHEPGSEWGIQPTVKGMSIATRLAYALWLIRLPSQAARRIVHRLKVPRAVSEEILAARRLWREFPQLASSAPSEVVARFSGVPPLAIYAVYLAVDDVNARAVLENYIFRWRHVAPHTTGHDLRKLNLPPGPVYKQILDTLRAAWLDGKIDSPEQEAELLEKVLSEKQVKTSG
jgi:tRNA nucleotidyltransferase (CCA-adding enzyme)